LKIDIRMIEDEKGKINHAASVGILVTSLQSGKESICEECESQMQNANIALLRLI
jgi:hypothetical protein